MESWVGVGSWQGNICAGFKDFQSIAKGISGGYKLQFSLKKI